MAGIIYLETLKQALYVFFGQFSVSSRSILSYVFSKFIDKNDFGNCKCILQMKHIQ